MFAVRTYPYTVTEYDARRPWLIVGPLRRMTVELEDGEDFATWAAKAWPRPRYQADREPEPLPPWECAD
ncbi:MAG: hypothetical protein WAU75_20480 [Solirubrobacteraceae bacterium]